MSEVQLCEIEKRYGGNRILDALDLTVSSGHYLVLLGQSGCGKTTTLKIIAGLESADEGRVTIDGRDMSAVPPRQRDVAMVFQGDALYPHLTIEQSLRIGLKGVVAGDELRKRIEEATHLVGIDHILNRKPAGLSGGELRRAAVAKAIVRRSSVRLLDEPLSALDASVRYAIGESLLRWHENYAGTTIHVTHDGQEAMRMADQIAVIDDGKIVQCSSPQEIYESPVNRTVALAVGSPLMNFFDATLVDGRLTFATDDISAVGPPHLFDVKDRGVSLGIRAPACRILNSQSVPEQPGVFISGKAVRSRMIDGRKLTRIAVADSCLLTESADRSILDGSDVKLFVHANELYVFDRITGDRLTHSADSL